MGEDSSRSVYNCIHMTEYKSVRLTEDVYETLRRRKRPDESFSEAVDRLASEHPIADLAGILSDEEVEAIRAAREESYGDYASERDRRWEE